VIGVAKQIAVDAQGKDEHAFSLVLLWNMLSGLVIPDYRHTKHLVNYSFSVNYNRCRKGQLRNLDNNNETSLKDYPRFKSLLRVRIPSPISLFFREGLCGSGLY